MPVSVNKLLCIFVTNFSQRGQVVMYSKAFTYIFTFIFMMCCLNMKITSQDTYSRPAKSLSGFPVKNVNNFKNPEDVSTSMIFTSFDYSSNTNTLGNFNQFVRQPSYSPSVSYFSRYGFDLGVTGVLTDNSDDSLEASTMELDLTAGYSLYLFDSRLIIYPSYSHFFYSSNTGSLKSLFSDNMQLGITYMNKILTLGNTSNYMLGSEKTFMTTFFTSLNAEKEDFLLRNSLIVFQPELDINFGDYEYLNNYYLDYFREHPLQMLDFLTLKDYYELRLLRRGNPDITTDEIIDFLIEKKSEDQFKATSFGIIFPLYYMIGNFSLNLSTMIYFPLGMPDYLDSSTQVYFIAGVSYTFGF